MTTYMSILLQCVQESQFKVYFGKIYWYKAVNRWTLCTHQELRLISKFVMGFLAPVFEFEDLLTLHFDEDETQAILSLLLSAAAEKPLKHFFFDISTSTLLNSLICLMLLICEFPSLKENFQELLDSLKDENSISSLSEIVQGGSTLEKLKASTLLFVLSSMDDPPSWTVSFFQEMVEGIAENEARSLIKCVLSSLDSSGLEGESYLNTKAGWLYAYT